MGSRRLRFVDENEKRMQNIVAPREPEEDRGHGGRVLHKPSASQGAWIPGQPQTARMENTHRSRVVSKKATNRLAKAKKAEARRGLIPQNAKATARTATTTAQCRRSHRRVNDYAVTKSRPPVSFGIGATPRKPPGECAASSIAKKRRVTLDFTHPRGPMSKIVCTCGKPTCLICTENADRGIDIRWLKTSPSPTDAEVRRRLDNAIADRILAKRSDENRTHPSTDRPCSIYELTLVPRG